MRKIAFILCVSLMFSGCAYFTTSKHQSYESEKYPYYQPLPPVPAKTVTYYDKNNNTDQTKEWECLDDNEKRELLPIQSARVSVHQIDVQGKVSYLAAAVSGDVGSYKVVMDYMKYRVEPWVDEKNPQVTGTQHVGVGLRINMNVVTTKANLDLGGIMAVGANASAGNLRGGISVDVIGIDSKDVTNLIPLTGSIDQSSIQAALQALASIKSKLWETPMTITPHRVGIQFETLKSQSQDKIKQKL